MSMGYPGRKIIKEGQLDKWCIKLKQWKPKWVTIELRHTVYVLSYVKSTAIQDRNWKDIYETEKDILLKDVKVYTSMEKPLIFYLKLSDTNRKYKFRAKTTDVCNEWRVAIVKLFYYDDTDISESDRCLSSITFGDERYQLSSEIEHNIKSRSSFSVYRVNAKNMDILKKFWKKNPRKTDTISNVTQSLKLSVDNKIENNSNNNVDVPTKTTDFKSLPSTNKNVDQTVFNSTENIAKKLKQLKTLSKNISTLHCDTLQSLEASTDKDDMSRQILNLFKQHEVLTGHIDDIFHKFMNIMHKDDLVDFLNNYFDEYVFKMDPFYFNVPMNETSYCKVASLIFPILSSNIPLKFNDIPIEAIKPKPLTELITCIFAHPSYLFNIINGKDGKNHIEHFTTYLCRCLQELISNKFLHVGIPLLPIPNEYFSCYFTDPHIPHFKVYINTKCVSLNPLRIFVEARDNRYEFDLEINLILAMETQKDSLFDVDVRFDGVFTLWKPEDTLKFSTSSLKLLYKEQCVCVELTDEISIQSIEKPQLSSHINLTCENSDSNLALLDCLDLLYSINNDDNITESKYNNVVNEWCHDFNLKSYNFEKISSEYGGTFIVALFRIPMFIACILINFVFNLISYDNTLGSLWQLSSTHDNNSLIEYIPKRISRGEDLECTINIKPFINCTISKPPPPLLDTNTTNEVAVVDSQHEKLCYSIDAFNEKYVKNKKANGINCYVMQSNNFDKEKYSSRTLWANTIICIENKDKENFLRELTTIQSKIKDYSI